MERIAVIDYGMGNLRSVEKALGYVAGERFDVVVTQDPAIVRDAERVVFPGQGAIRDCMRQIRHHRLEACVRQAIEEKPFLGICIGLQALMDSSDEDPDTKGLGVFAGGCRRFPSDARDPTTGERLKIPHMGWNQVRRVKDHPLWQGIEDEARFYFVHSYHVVPDERSVVAATSCYAGEFVCAVAQRRLFAVQFHPEKSQHNGLRLIENFLAWHPE